MFTHTLLLVLALAVNHDARSESGIDTPAQLQELIARSLRRHELTPGQQRQILDAVATELKDPETLRLYSAMSAVRKKLLMEEFTRDSGSGQDNPAYNTPLLIQAWAEGTATTIRGYVRIPPVEAATPVAVQQIHELRAICDERISEMYPGIMEIERWRTMGVQSLDRMINDQENDLTYLYKVELPRDEFEQLAATLRKIPAESIELNRPNRRRRQRRGRMPPVFTPGLPAGDKGIPAHITELPWADANRELREGWINRGMVNLASQFVSPVATAYRTVSPFHGENKLIAFLREHESSLDARVQAEREEIRKRLEDEQAEKQQRDWEKTLNRAGGPQLEPRQPRSVQAAKSAVPPTPDQPPPQSSPDSARGRLAWVLAVNGVAGAALAALFLRRWFKQK